MAKQHLGFRLNFWPCKDQIMLSNFNDENGALGEIYYFSAILYLVVQFCTAILYLVVQFCTWWCIVKYKVYLNIRPYGKIRPSGFLVIRPCQKFGLPFFYDSAFRIRPNDPVRKVRLNMSRKPLNKIYFE